MEDRKIASHKELNVWRDAITLAKSVYALTSGYPKEETYGLVVQMRRSAVSIASNIAEGAARSGNREFAKFLYVAAGSASELDTQLEISREVAFGNAEYLIEVQKAVERISKMLRSLIRSVKLREER